MKALSSCLSNLLTVDNEEEALCPKGFHIEGTQISLTATGS